MFSHNFEFSQFSRVLIFNNRSFSSDVTAAILVYQNNEMAAILVYGTGISSFLFKYFVLFHHPTGATDHVSENDLLFAEGEVIIVGEYSRGDRGDYRR